ncbi:uncharacterized membrane protein YoaK (UPF0700 family) [Catenibacillus scindens]|uniref:Uncharacterized membrane protein YoaK (UPF0700 family) n=1 Tax=Catenibacillus scindens TaxID=673271 RepID=A0A7W8M4I0_9FIRM|nr:uncharacterized membrane protein YoaK (UPF0700 family) [Catenibacillus scindens]
MNWLKKENDTALHYNMCLVGGFLGAYAMFLRGGNFGSAQTGNLIEAVMEGLGGQWQELLIRVGGLAIYICAIVASFLLGKSLSKGKMRRLCFFVEAVGILAAAILPEKMNDILALYPVFFITAFQWGVFSGAKGYNSATIFSTNNIKQTVLGWTEYFRTKDLKQREKAVFYTLTLTFFHTGVAAGFLATTAIGAPAALCCLAPLGSAAVITVMGEEPKRAVIREKAVS